MANKNPPMIAVIALIASAFASQSFAQSPAARPTTDAVKSVPVQVFALKNPRSKAVIEAQRNNENLHAIKSKIAVFEARSKLLALERSTITTTSESMQPVKALPKVVSVFGEISDLSALIVFAGGTTRRIKNGQSLGGMRVSTITLEEVLLKDANGIEVRLPFTTHLSTEEAIKESLKESAMPSPVEAAVSAPTGFSALPKMPVFAGPLPLAKP